MINLFGFEISGFDTNYDIPVLVSTGYSENSISIGTIDKPDVGSLVEVDVVESMHDVDMRTILALYGILALNAIFCILIVRQIWRIFETILTQQTTIFSVEKPGHEATLLSLVNCVFFVVLIFTSLLCTSSILKKSNPIIDSIEDLVASVKRPLFIEIVPVYNKLQRMRDPSARLVYNRFRKNGRKQSIIDDMSMDSMTDILDRLSNGDAIFGPDDLQWILRCFLCLRDNGQNSREVYHISDEKLFRSIWSVMYSRSIDFEVRHRIHWALSVIVQSGVSEKLRQDLPLMFLSGLGVELQLKLCLLKSAINNEKVNTDLLITLNNLHTTLRVMIILMVVSVLRLVYETGYRKFRKIKRKFIRSFNRRN